MLKTVSITVLSGIYLILTACQAKEPVDTSFETDVKSEVATVDSTKTLKSDSASFRQETTPPIKPTIRIDVKEAEPSELQDEVSAKKEDGIVRGSVSNTFHQKPNQLVFQSSVTEDQDPQIGCSGGGNLLTFTIPCTADSFCFKNEELRALQLKYRIDGGMFFATGENPRKGKIAGRKKDDSTWIVEMDILVPMHSDQRQQEERPIKRKIEFSKVN